MEGFPLVSEVIPAEMDSPHPHHPHNSEVLLSLLARHKTLEGSSLPFIQVINSLPHRSYS